MVHPGFQLNPGDMFQVEPDRVLYATGATKDAAERRATRKFRSKVSSDDESMHESTSKEPPPKKPKSSEPSTPTHPRTKLSKLLEQAKSVLSTPSQDLTAKRKRDLRAFQQALKRTISRPTSLTESLDAQVLEMAHKLNISVIEDAPGPDLPSAPLDPKQAAISDAEKALLKQALAEAKENPIDPSKSYATPWRPREYMSAFAFIPRYLEVHHKVCSAVYLRHPVARPGLGEVPTPYPIETNALAFNWYLRRR